MVGVSFAAIPLYRVFCAVTGYARHAADRRLRSLPAQRVRTSPSASMPTPTPTCRGTSARCRRRSACRSARSSLPSTPRATWPSTPVTGVALYNVTPDTAGKYFHKTACFCFNQQTLAAGQQMQFPLSFWVDPAIAKDPEHRGHPHDHAVLHVLPHARRRGEVRRTRAGRSACRSADSDADPLNPCRRFGDDAAAVSRRIPRQNWNGS